MSILSVDQIQPIGSGTTVTLNATEVKTGTEITVGTGASIFSPAGNTLTFGTNNVERIRIKNDGKIGIGTDNPTFKVDVQGSGGDFTKLALSNQNMNSSKYEIIFGDQGQVNHIVKANREFTIGTNNLERFRIASNGHVAIGTDSPNSALPLTIAGQYPGIQFKDNQGTTDFNINADSAAFRIQSGTAGAGPSEKFRIGSSGQIGLGGANYGSSGQVLTSQGSGSAVQWANVAAGITMMDQWSITNDNNKSNGQVIDSNWERADYFFAQIGTGMSESSGIFTFPQTGIYLIMSQHQMNGGASYAGVGMELSTNSGSSYGGFSYGYQNMSTVGGYHHLSLHGICDVTNASTHRFRLVAINSSSTQYSGNTERLRNGVTFIRLGDT